MDNNIRTSEEIYKFSFDDYYEIVKDQPEQMCISNISIDELINAKRDGKGVRFQLVQDKRSGAFKMIKGWILQNPSGNLEVEWQKIFGVCLMDDEPIPRLAIFNFYIIPEGQNHTVQISNELAFGVDPDFSAVIS